MTNIKESKPIIPSPLTLAGSNGHRLEFLQQVLCLKTTTKPLGTEPLLSPLGVAIWKIRQTSDNLVLAVDAQQTIESGNYLTKPKNWQEILTNMRLAIQNKGYTTEVATALKIDGQTKIAVNQIQVTLNTDRCQALIGNWHLFTHWYLENCPTDVDVDNVAGGFLLEAFLALGAVKKIEINGQSLDLKDQGQLDKALYFVKVGFDLKLLEQIKSYYD
jgi:hypothetical protein